MIFSCEFKCRAPEFRTHLIIAHTTVRDKNIRHFICNSTYICHIFHVRSTIGYDKLMMRHKMLNRLCPEKLKNRFTCRYSCFSVFAISRKLISAHLLKGTISLSKMHESKYFAQPIIRATGQREKLMCAKISTTLYDTSNNTNIKHFP